MAAPGWTVELEAFAPRPAPLPSEVARSFARLDAVARGARASFSIATVQDCPLPFLDVQIRDDEGAALAGVAVTLDFPAGAGRRAPTDASGLAHFPGVDVDATTLDVELHRDWPPDAQRPSYRARVRAKQTAPADAVPPAPVAAAPFLYALPRFETDEVDDDASATDWPPATLPDAD